MAKFIVEPLSRENYDIWKIQMKALLIKSEGLQYANGTNQKPELIKGDSINAANIAAWILADQKTHLDIILSISPSALKQVKHCII